MSVLVYSAITQIIRSTHW